LRASEAGGNINSHKGGAAMNRMIAISATTAALLGCAGLVAHGQQQPPPAMTFFIAANPTGTANLGGLAGADQICQNAAQASGGLNFNHICHAYLSQEQRGNTPRINARDRIGSRAVAQCQGPVDCQ
jgi:hypothetical protein